MKKVTLILTAIALVFGMVQCKKEKVEQSAPTEEVLGDPVHITVNVGDNGKHIVIPHIGMYAFTENDSLYVGCGNCYVGTLTYDEKIAAFDGTINVHTAVVGNDYLHFYFVGGLAPQTSSPLSPNNTPSFDVDISDQTGNLPVLSYGRSNEKYTGQGSYNCTLLNKCALVEFALTNGISRDVYVDGMKTQAKVDFANPGITAKETRGSIKLYSKSNSRKWAVLLPQDEVSDASMYSNINSNSITVDVPAITENAFIHGTSAISIASDPLLTTPPGVISGMFSVSATRKVYFSQGNLQYTQSTGTWSFMTNQYGTVETLNQYVGENYADQDIVTLFGYGTGNNPTNTSSFNGSYGTFNNWGKNAISNGGNTENGGWRTLTDGEWEYLFGNSIERDGKHGHGSVDGVNGMILLPDDWTLPSSLSFTSGNSYNSNTYTVEQWAAMEANGAVFLPAAGQRDRTSDNVVAATVKNVGSYGYYWSSRNIGNTAVLMEFYDGTLYPSISISRYKGLSVRLVKVAN